MFGVHGKHMVRMSVLGQIKLGFVQVNPNTCPTVSGVLKFVQH